MPVKKVTTKKTTSLRATAKQSTQGKVSTKIATKPAVSPNDKLSIPVYSLLGKETGTLDLPKEVFGQKVNKKLLAQAVRVYTTNQKNLLASTKTRGEVEGSSAKIFRQKGTGRARHGSVRAPIFVGGGIVFGPQSRKVRLVLPKKMKKAALFTALSAKAADKAVVGVTEVDKASGKTKEIVQLLVQLNSKFSPREAGKNQKSKFLSALIITGEKTDNVVRAVRNIPGVNALPVNLINAYEVVRHGLLVVTKDALAKLSKGEVK